MDNRVLLNQARRAISFQIEQSPDIATGSRVPTVSDGFGGSMVDPFGTATPFSVKVRLSHERSGVRQTENVPAGLDTALTLFALWSFDSVLKEDEVISVRGRSFKVGVVDALKKFGGVQAYQAPLYPAGAI